VFTNCTTSPTTTEMRPANCGGVPLVASPKPASVPNVGSLVGAIANDIATYTTFEAAGVTVLHGAGVDDAEGLSVPLAVAEADPEGEEVGTL
jgi:hypothetical protein